MKDTPEVQKVLYEYVEVLGIGIVNIVNMIRPQVILLGGRCLNMPKR